MSSRRWNRIVLMLVCTAVIFALGYLVSEVLGPEVFRRRSARPERTIPAVSDTSEESHYHGHMSSDAEEVMDPDWKIESPLSVRALLEKCSASKDVNEMVVDDQSLLYVPDMVHAVHSDAKPRIFCNVCFREGNVFSFSGSKPLTDVFGGTSGAPPAAGSGGRVDVPGVAWVVQPAQMTVEAPLILPWIGEFMRNPRFPGVSHVLEKMSDPDFEALGNKYGKILSGAVLAMHELQSSRPGAPESPPELMNLNAGSVRDHVTCFKSVVYFPSYHPYRESKGCVSGFSGFDAGAGFRRAAFKQCGIRESAAHSRKTFSGEAADRRVLRSALILHGSAENLRAKNVEEAKAAVEQSFLGGDSSTARVLDAVALDSMSWCEIVSAVAGSDVVVFVPGPHAFPAMLANDQAPLISLRFFNDKYSSVWRAMIGDAAGASFFTVATKDPANEVGVLVDVDKLVQALDLFALRSDGSGAERPATSKGKQYLVNTCDGGGFGHQFMEWDAPAIIGQEMGIDFCFDKFIRSATIFNDVMLHGVCRSDEVRGNNDYERVRLSYQERDGKDFIIRQVDKFLENMHESQNVVLEIQGGQNFESHCGAMPFARTQYLRGRERYPIRSKYDSNMWNVAIHVRRGDATRDQWRLLPCDYFRNAAKNLLPLLKEKQNWGKSGVVFHVFSAGERIEWFSCMSQDSELKNVLKFHLDEEVRETFHHLVLADVLVTSKSSFPYVAGLMSAGVKIVHPFWHETNCGELWIPTPDSDAGTFDAEWFRRSWSKLHAAA